MKGKQGQEWPTVSFQLWWASVTLSIAPQCGCSGAAYEWSGKPKHGQMVLVLYWDMFQEFSPPKKEEFYGLKIAKVVKRWSVHCWNHTITGRTACKREKGTGWEGMTILSKEIYVCVWFGKQEDFTESIIKLTQSNILFTEQPSLSIGHLFLHITRNWVLICTFRVLLVRKQCEVAEKKQDHVSKCPIAAASLREFRKITWFKGCLRVNHTA